jgi:hypothetical protein
MGILNYYGMEHEKLMAQKRGTSDLNPSIDVWRGNSRLTVLALGTSIAMQDVSSVDIIKKI